MRKTVVGLAALLLAAGMVAAQPSPPEAPEAPMAPQACGMHGGGGMGHGCGGGMGMMGGRGHMGRGEAPVLQFREELGLSDQQVGQIEDMRTEHQLAMIDRRAELQKAELRLRNLMQEGNAPERDVNAAIDEVARLRADMQKARYQQHQQMLSVLTDAQQEKLEQLRNERQDTRREFRQERRQQMREDGQGQGQGFRGRRF